MNVNQIKLDLEKLYKHIKITENILDKTYDFLCGLGEIVPDDMEITVLDLIKKLEELDELKF